MDAAEVDDPIMLSALQHYSYCLRQCALIHVEQAFDENVHTMRGNAGINMSMNRVLNRLKVYAVNMPCPCGQSD